MEVVQEKIGVVIYGEPETGKRTLAAALTGRAFTRRRDKKTYVIDAQLGNNGAARPIGLVTVDATHLKTFSKSLLEQVASVTRASAVVITKADLVPRDYSPEHLALLRQQPYMAANYDVECFAVSATTNDNVDNLLAWIVDTFAPITATRAEISSFRLQSFLHSLLDVIAACFALPNATRTPDVDEEVSKLTSYEDIRSLLRGDLAEKWDANLKHRLLADHAQYVTVHRITPSLILKEGSACGPSERATMEYVLQHTTIPVPRVHCPDQPHLIMDHIEGEMLSECWDQLSSFMQFRIACTLRLYVRQLQNLKSQHVGDVESGYAGGIFFDGSWYGPFDSVKRFRQFCEWIAFEGWRPFACAARLNQRPIPPLPNSCSDWAPVFTHGDLNPSNILLSKDGVLWVIDWGEAGFYPSCMETLVMRHHDTVVHAEDHPPSWKRYREFIAGIATKEEQEFWGHFHTAIHRFPGRDIQ